MQNVLDIWSGMDNRRRVIAVVSTVAMFAAVLMLSKLAASRPMDLLYAGLENGAAGEVIAALEQQAVPFEVRGNGIYVEAASRDRIRMVLAGQSLPANGSAGYELLDGLSGFGTTAQMFDAAYWRAKEGELARTIAANPQVRSARVHISTSPSHGFRAEKDMSASVSVSAGPGGLTEAQAKAFRYLVASAVSGLRPGDVTVIDGDSGLVLGTADGQPVEDGKRAAALKRNVERLLEAHVGPGNAVVEVSVESVTERESISERRFDPEGRVAISTETEERTNNARGSSGGAVTVASNLPDGNAGAGGSDSQSQNSESRERVNFEVSETHREVLREPGSIRRLTVAVMVNARTVVDPQGNTSLEPRTDEELADLRSLIEAAVGYDEARGDQITLRSLEFQPYPEGSPFSSPGILDRLDLTRLIQMAALAAVVLILGLFVIRPVLTRREPVSVLELGPPGDGPAAQVGQSAQSGESTSAALVPAIDLAGEFGSGGDTGFDGLPDLTVGASDPVARLRQLISERQQETVEVLRSWMEDDREDA